MGPCNCGATRRKFWLWRDHNDELHASAFEPGNSAERVVMAVTVRDALLSATGGVMPKHAVGDATNPEIRWEGRCSLERVPSRA